MQVAVAVVEIQQEARVAQVAVEMVELQAQRLVRQILVAVAVATIVMVRLPPVAQVLLS
jgi:hypothetical protein